MGRGTHRDGFPDYRDTSAPGQHLRGRGPTHANMLSAQANFGSNSPQYRRAQNEHTVAESRNAAFQSGGMSASMGRAAERDWGGQTNTEEAPGYIFGGRY